MLNEISESRKDKYSKIPLYKESKIVKLIDAVSKMVVSRDWGLGRGKGGVVEGSLGRCYEVSVTQDK